MRLGKSHRIHWCFACMNLASNAPFLSSSCGEWVRQQAHDFGSGSRGLLSADAFPWQPSSGHRSTHMTCAMLHLILIEHVLGLAQFRNIPTFQDDLVESGCHARTRMNARNRHASACAELPRLYASLSMCSLAAQQQQQHVWLHSICLCCVYLSPCCLPSCWPLCLPVGLPICLAACLSSCLALHLCDCLSLTDSLTLSLSVSILSAACLLPLCFFPQTSVCPRIFFSRDKGEHIHPQQWARQTGKQTDRQTDRQTYLSERQTERDIYIYMHILYLLDGWFGAHSKMQCFVLSFHTFTEEE